MIPVRRHAWIQAIAVMVLATALASCGGGGGGGGGSSGPPPATFSLSTSSLTFNAASTAITPPSQAVTGTVTGVSSGTLYIAVQIAGQGVATVNNLTVTGTTTAQAQVMPTSAALLGPGTFTSTLTVRACTTDASCSGALIGTPQTINVTYTVHGVTSATTALSYSIADAPQGSDLNRTLNITSGPGDTWTSSSSVPWLTLNPASGAAGSTTSVTAALVPAQLNLLENGTYTGTVTLTPSTGLPQTIALTLSILRLTVDTVSPYIARSGTTAEVIIHGSAFSAANVTGVNFGSTPATTYRVVNSSELRATHPAMTAGRYTVHVQNTFGTDRTRATLVVADAVPFAAATLAYPDATPTTVRDLAYDAERRALLVARFNPAAPFGSHEVLRYAYGGSWSAPQRHAIDQLSALTLSSDGQAILAASIFNAIETRVTRLDPATLAETGFSSHPSQGIYSGMAFASDGRALLVPTFLGILGYDDRSRILAAQQPSTLAAISNVHMGASADGSRIVLTQGLSNPPGALLMGYDPQTAQLVQATVARRADDIKVNRDGSRILFDRVELTDGAYNVLGRLPANSQAAALAPNGTRAYLYDNAGTLHTYDLTAATVGGLFPEIGTGVSLLASPVLDTVKMLVTPDGGTLILAERSQIFIRPLP